MSKELLNKLTGELLDIKSVQPVTIVDEPLRFKTNYTDNSADGDAEVNSGEYIVDDSQYIDFKKLLQRSANCSKEAIDFLSQIPVVDNVGGIDEDDLQNVINNNETEVSVDKSENLSTGATESPQEANEVVNPVDKLPDVEQSETNGNQ